jgi:hypothetical protein
MKKQQRECVNMQERCHLSSKFPSRKPTKLSKEDIKKTCVWPDLMLPPINLWNAPAMFWGRNNDTYY